MVNVFPFLPLINHGHLKVGKRTIPLLDVVKVTVAHLRNQPFSMCSEYRALVWRLAEYQVTHVGKKGHLGLNTTITFTSLLISVLHRNKDKLPDLISYSVAFLSLGLFQKIVILKSKSNKYA